MVDQQRTLIADHVEDRAIVLSESRMLHGREGRIVASRLERMRRGQSERLVPMIQEVMAEGKASYSDLDTLAVTIGPGGFTGVRIGLATARGLALACGCPLVGMSNFEVLAATAKADVRPDGSLVVLIDAKRHELYVQAFAADLKPRMDPLSIAPEALVTALPDGPLVLAGDAVEQAMPALRKCGRDFSVSKVADVTDAAWLAELVATNPDRAMVTSHPQPLYLRAPDVTPPESRSTGPRS